jgi:hypothetical protein
MFQKVLLKLNRARRVRSGIIALCAIGAIVLVTAGPSPLLANPGMVTVRVDPATRAAPVNGTFTVDIVVDNVDTEMNPDGLGAYEFDLVYDQDYLEVDSASDAGELDDTGRTVNELGPNISNPDGRTTFAAYSHPPADTNGPANPTVALATVTLNAKWAGVTTLSLENALLTDTQANAWPDVGQGRYLDVQASTMKVNMALGQYDDDGRTDRGIFRDGAWIARQSTDGSTFWLWFGQTGDKLVPADYDGDGQTDPAIFRDGGWYVMGSSDGFSLTWFGKSTDVPAPGDYDGDGKADPTFFRDGAWVSRRSSDGSTFWLWFGQTGDKLVPADYDGDGQTDPAIFRDGGWYVMGSSDGFSLMWVGRSTDVPLGLVN